MIATELRLRELTRCGGLRPYTVLGWESRRLQEFARGGLDTRFVQTTVLEQFSIRSDLDTEPVRNTKANDPADAELGHGFGNSGTQAADD